VVNITTRTWKNVIFIYLKPASEPQAVEMVAMILRGGEYKDQVHALARNLISLQTNSRVPSSSNPDGKEKSNSMAKDST
jgi:hypothetical protein